MRFHKFKLFDNSRDFPSHFKQVITEIYDSGKFIDFDDMFITVRKLAYKTVFKFRDQWDAADLRYIISAFYNSIWELEHRPFYRVYPGIIEALKRLNLSKVFKFTDAKLINSLVIELPVEYPIVICGYPIEVIQFSCYLNEHKQKQFYILLQSGGRIMAMIDYSAEKLDQIMQEEDHSSWYADDLNDDTENDDKRVWAPDFFLALDEFVELLSIIGGLLFLEHSSDLFEPVVLKKDTERYKTADEPTRQRYADKAKRLGVNGFHVGRIVPTKADIERMNKENKEALENGKKAPHLRIAHLHTFYTGKGRTTPIIKLVKALFVNKDKMFDLPQDYYDKCGN